MKKIKPQFTFMAEFQYAKHPYGFITLKSHQKEVTWYRSRPTPLRLTR